MYSSAESVSSDCDSEYTPPSSKKSKKPWSFPVQKLKNVLDLSAEQTKKRFPEKQSQIPPILTETRTPDLSAKQTKKMAEKQSRTLNTLEEKQQSRTPQAFIPTPEAKKLPGFQFQILQRADEQHLQDLPTKQPQKQPEKFLRTPKDLSETRMLQNLPVKLQQSRTPSRHLPEKQLPISNGEFSVTE